MLEAFIERQTRTVRANQVLIALRLLLAAATLTVLLIGYYQKARVTTPAQLGELQPLYLQPAGLMAIIVCVLTVLYLLAAKRLAQEPAEAAKLAFVQIFVDIFLISALVWNTGGVESRFVVLYLMSVCAAAFVLKWNVAILCAATSTILFSLVTLLYSIGLIPENYRAQLLEEHLGAHLEKLQNLGALDFLHLLLLPACAFFLTGILAGTLSRRLLMARLVHDEILEGIGEGLAVLDGERKVLYHNREFQRLVGLQASPQKMGLKELLGSAIDQHAQEVLADGALRRIEARHRYDDGRIVPLAVRIVPMMEPDTNTPRGVILALDDITAEKRMEEFLKHRQRLETMGHISATIAHEIRNPLASIRGAVQEIGRVLDIPEDKKVLLEIVLSESDRLDQIISDFLRFARMRPPKLVQTDIGRVLADVKLLLAARPEAKDTQILLGGDEGEPFLADPEQLRQILLNLGLNAFQAMAGSPRKELALRVSVMPRSRVLGLDPAQALDRPGVLVEMADSGPGMNAEVQKRIFEPFFTTKPAGTGLGLAIAERVVQGHEGLIFFESKEGVGTTFRIWLPTNLTASLAGISGLRPHVTDLGVGKPGPGTSRPASEPDGGERDWSTGRASRV
ncbi:MAG: ATP-binding protein [Planctomycetota bacterium]